MPHDSKPYRPEHDDLLKMARLADRVLEDIEKLDGDREESDRLDSDSLVEKARRQKEQHRAKIHDKRQKIQEEFRRKRYRS